MNLIWLDDFLVLAGSGNFSRAAELRHMTQPAFSRRIRALEDWLGVPLFDRSTQPATLTEAGEWFRSVAQGLQTSVAALPDQARAAADASAATLRIAATHALSFSFLPGWLRGVESRLQAGPGPVQLISDVMQHCEALMQQGRVHFLLCHAHPQVPLQLDPAGHRHAVVGHDTLLPLSAADDQGQALHWLDGPRGLVSALSSAPASGAASGQASGTPPSPASGATPGPVPWLDYSAESGIGRLVRALRGSALAHAQAQPAMTAHLATVLQTMALAGRGVAWLPQSLIGDDLASGRLVPAGAAHWAIAVEIRLLRPAAPLPRAAERFWQVVVEAQPAR